MNGLISRPISRLIRNETAMPVGAQNGAPDADTFEVSLPSSPVTAANLLDFTFAPARSSWTSRDIGSVDFEGGAVNSNGLYLVRGGGTDISGTNDSFHFMYVPLSGDAQLTARALSQAPTDPWAKAGIMLRETLDPASRHASIFVTPSSGLSFQWRPNAGGATSSNGTLPGAAPFWARLVRSGPDLAGYISGNGTNWTPAGSIGLNGLGPLAYWGLAVTAHNNSTSSVAVFDTVAVHSLVSISTVPDQSAFLGAAVPAIPFTVGSATIPADSLVVTALSTNSSLLPSNNIVVSGTSSNRWVVLMPAAGRSGTSAVTLTVSDGVYSASTTFTLTVNPLPQLSISTNEASGRIGLSWPLYAGGMTIWSATNLSPPVSWWRAADATLATNDGNIVASFPATNTTRFFRLSTQTE